MAETGDSVPELPEVETCRRGLEAAMVGHRIVSVEVSKPNAIFLTKPAELRRRLEGQSISRIDRRGKYLMLRFAESSLLVHLGMTGTMGAAGPTRSAHQHLRLSLDNGSIIAFRDPRTFGRLQWYAGDDELVPRISRLGPDALTIEAARLFDHSRGRRSCIKAMLLDQSVYAGLGNIYCDETLFRSHVRPQRKAGKVTRAECERLAINAKAVLQRAIELGGSSISDFVAADGASGYFQIEHQVYGRAGEPCLACATPIRKAVVAQRGTHWCPKCQK